MELARCFKSFRLTESRGTDLLGYNNGLLTKRFDCEDLILRVELRFWFKSVRIKRVRWNELTTQNRTARIVLELNVRWNRLT